ncbi:MAG: Gfo/Idh/MocA family oxidoreductase [bacterium]
MNKQDCMNRRRFLKTTGKGATTLAALAASAPAVLQAGSPNETIGVGCIGLGVRGGTLCRQAAAIEGAKIVAVCDVYKPHIQKGVERSGNPDVRTYLDYHDLLADPDVDAVTIATPDHWHSKILIDAANAAKDIYIEKGWTRTIAEAKAMHAAIKKSGVIMQLGHQGRERASGVQAAALIEQDLIGPVTLVRTGRFENRPLGRNIWRWYGGYNEYERPDPAQVQRDLDWDRWLGPAPKCPFSMEHFWHWRCYWNYATGVAGDLLSHELDFVQSLLRHGIPDTCVCTGLNALLKDGREVPDTWNTVYGFEKQGRTVTFDCSMNTSALVQAPEFYGKDAVIRFDTIAQSVNTFDVYAERESVKYGPRIDAGEVKYGEPFLKFDPSRTPEQPVHMQNFFDSVRSRKKAKCNEDEAFVEAATLIMSVIAYKEQRPVRWDSEKQELI